MCDLVFFLCLIMLDASAFYRKSSPCRVFFGKEQNYSETKGVKR